MTTKTAIARREQQRQHHLANRKQAVSDEGKSLLRDMRRLGFAPRKGAVTQKHFERYTAYLETQSMANKASALNSEVAVFNANGGLMSAIFDRLNKPSLKDTAFANLSAVALRAVSLAPTLADRMRSELAGQTDVHMTDAELEALEREVMKGVRND